MSQGKGYELGDTEDATRHGGRGRKRDLEATFLSFPITSADGLYHDADMRKRFRLALLRADQQWDQAQAGVDARRRTGRQDAFRRRLDALLQSESYRHLDGATKERLLAEVTALVLAGKEREP